MRCFSTKPSRGSVLGELLHRVHVGMQFILGFKWDSKKTTLEVDTIELYGPFG